MLVVNYPYPACACTAACCCCGRSFGFATIEPLLFRGVVFVDADLPPPHPRRLSDGDMKSWLIWTGWKRAEPNYRVNVSVKMNGMLDLKPARRATARTRRHHPGHSPRRGRR